MKIEVEVKAQSKRESIEKISEHSLRIHVNAPPVDGKANEAVIKALAEHYKVSKSRISLIRGHKSKKKLFEIQLEPSKK